MNKRAINLFIAFNVILSGCGSQSALSPTLVPEARTTIPSAPSATLSPTVTPAFTPELPAHGPYLLAYSDNDSFTIIGPEGAGSKKYTLPNNGTIPYPLESAVSPDGEWIAYHTGSDEPPYDLTLHLFNISDGATRTISPLISPENQEEQYEIIYFWFVEGIRSLAWSPDGRFLAFAAQIDGPSSDLYLYDLEEESIRRLSDEIYNIFRVEWSPGGNWIIYKDSIPSNNYSGGTLFTINFIDGVIGKPAVVESDFWSRGIGWLTENIYLITGISDGGPPSHLRYHNLETNQVFPLCPYAHYSIAFVPDQERIVFSCDPFEFEPHPPPPFNTSALYYAYLDGRSGQFTEELYFDLAFQGGPRPRFLSTDPSGLIAISLDGSPAVIYTPDEETQDHFWREQIAISPDQRWVAVYGPDGFKLFDEEDRILFEVRDASVSSILWRPDSQGILIFSGKNNVVYYAISGNYTVDFCSLGHCPLGYVVWLP